MMYVDMVIGLMIGCTLVAILPYVWLSLKIAWELMTAVFGLLAGIYHLICHKVKYS